MQHDHAIFFFLLFQPGLRLFEKVDQPNQP